MSGSGRKVIGFWGGCSAFGGEIEERKTVLWRNGMDWIGGYIAGLLGTNREREKAVVDRVRYARRSDENEGGSCENRDVLKRDMAEGSDDVEECDDGKHGNSDCERSASVVAENPKKGGERN